MGSSKRKKANKKADFAKPKLKVGKTRPKNTNFTDTSFRTRAVVVPTQSLLTAGPSTSAQLETHISHLKSHSGSQKSDHLNALTSILASGLSIQDLPISITKLFSSLNQLILDPDNRVRAQLLKIYSLFPIAELKAEVGTLLPYIRAGIAHLSTDIRSTSLDLLAWALRSMGEEIVSCAGGWIKTLKTFVNVLGWSLDSQESSKDSNGWSSASVAKTSTSNLEHKILNTLATMLRYGFGLYDAAPTDRDRALPRWPFPLLNVDAHVIVQKPNGYARLNLFGAPREEESEMYVECEDRIRVFHDLGYVKCMTRGIASLTKEGGETGRAAGSLNKILNEISKS